MLYVMYLTHGLMYAFISVLFSVSSGIKIDIKSDWIIVIAMIILWPIFIPVFIYETFYGGKA